MENFIYGEKFYADVRELSEDLFESEEEIHQLPDNWEVTCYGITLEPIVEIDLDWVLDRIDEDRWTEDGDEIDRVLDIFNKYIDFDKINEEMPKLLYENDKDKFVITKQDLVDDL